MTNETIGTQPPELLEAMLAMIRRKGCVDAGWVTGYRERSYNIGYCETCSEIVTEVRIYFRTTDGADSHYQVEYRDLGELIRELTDEPDRQRAWNDAATHETTDERWDRASLHGFDEEPDE